MMKTLIWCKRNISVGTCWQWLTSFLLGTYFFYFSSRVTNLVEICSEHRGRGVEVSSQETELLRAQPAADVLAANSKTALTSLAADLPTVFEGVRARAFDSWDDKKALPCFAPEIKWKDSLSAPTTDGFIFVKPYKVGSTSLAGVNLRIARNVAKRRALKETNATAESSQKLELCKVRCEHIRAVQSYRNRDPSKSFMWSVLRDPTSRVVSQFFHFQVSRLKVEPSDENFIDYARNKEQHLIHDFYLYWLSLNDYNRGKDDAVAVANRIMEDYDFIGITERLDESLVALAMLLGLPLGDILFLSAKTRGGFDDGGGRETYMCTYIWPSFISEGMQKFLDSEEWKMRSHWDLVLYQAANRSLDLTIERLGRPLFERNLVFFKKAKELSREQCLPKTVFPCSEGGHFTPYYETDCMDVDAGCGNDCLDEVFDNMQLSGQVLAS